MADTFVVVGGDAVGMAAASKARRDDPDLGIVRRMMSFAGRSP